MANPRFSDVAPSRGTDLKGGGFGGGGRPASADMPMKTANWQGIPGKAGPNRSNGVPKANVYVKSEGI